MSIEETVKNTPIEMRPKIDDTPGSKPHYMTDVQYAEYLRVQGTAAEMPLDTPDPLGQMQEQIDELILYMAEKELGGVTV